MCNWIILILFTFYIHVEAEQNQCPIAALKDNNRQLASALGKLTLVYMYITYTYTCTCTCVLGHTKLKMHQYM